MYKESSEYKDMKIELESALSSVKVERSLSNVDAFKEKFEKGWEQITPIPNIRFGNKKVPKTTAIANTTSWFLCPGRLNGFCDLHEVCYDKYREVMGGAINSRLNHDLWWRLNDAETIAQFYIYSIKAQSLKHPEEPINLMRFQEVGDFRTQEDLDKMIEVSNLLYDTLQIKSYTYTHNRNLDFNKPRPHLTINGSDFMVDNQFTVVKPEKYKEYVKTHECIECPQKCKMCNSICANKLGIEIVEVEK